MTTTIIVRITIALPIATGTSVGPKRADCGECEQPRLRVEELKRSRFVDAQRSRDLGSLDGGTAGELEREEEQVQGSDELERELDLGESGHDDAEPGGNGERQDPDACRRADDLGDRGAEPELEPRRPQQGVVRPRRDRS